MSTGTTLGWLQSVISSTEQVICCVGDTSAQRALTKLWRHWQHHLQRNWPDSPIQSKPRDVYCWYCTVSLYSLACKHPILFNPVQRSSDIWRHERIEAQTYIRGYFSFHLAVITYLAKVVQHDSVWKPMILSIFTWDSLGSHAPYIGMNRPG